jgi:hypothetical protein
MGKYCNHKDIFILGISNNNIFSCQEIHFLVGISTCISFYSIEHCGTKCRAFEKMVENIYTKERGSYEVLQKIT